jgi:predicted DNA-binding transcriptional regulator YafY
MRGEQPMRQWGLIRLLLAHQEGLTVKELASALGIPQRSLYRDLEALKEAKLNIKLVWDEKYRRYYIPLDEPVKATS